MTSRIRDRHIRPSTASGTPDSFGSISRSSAVSQRRRSSAVHASVPPTAPPPNQPIPNVPGVSTNTPNLPMRMSDEENFYPSQLPHPSSGIGTHSFSRPIYGSENLGAVETSSQVRYASSSTGQPYIPTNGTSSPEILSDSPPKSLLHPSSSKSATRHQEVKPDRLLLSPPDHRTHSESRPSSRRALTQALELAREAVKLDSTNDDPYGAVIAYSRSVALLSEVMERVRRGEDSTESHRRRNGRRRSVVAQEEEVRRLKTIHDTYADRMDILSLTYCIPPIPHSPSSIYASPNPVSADATQPSSSSTSPSSDASDSAQRMPSHRPDHGREDSELFLSTDDHEEDATEAIGSAMFNMEISRNTVPLRGLTHAASSKYHPYATATAAAFVVNSRPQAGVPVAGLQRNATIPTASLPPVRRSRASSGLPPPPPPPLTSPPPAPPLNELPSEPPSATHSSVPTPRDARPGHTRTGSGSKLAALEEEMERYDDRQHPIFQEGYSDYDINLRHRQSLEPDTPRNVKRDHPLPPLPSPSLSANRISTDSLGTPRTSVLNGHHPSLGTVMPQKRLQEGSILSVTESASPPIQQNLINASTVMGTISQRRSKTSAPPVSTRSPSPANSTASASSTGAPRLPSLTLSTSTSASVAVGRNRAMSQPGQRPSVVGGRVSPFDHRPQIPSTAGLNGSSVSRKGSFPSKLNPNIQPLPHLIVQTDLPPGSLVPPPPIFPGNLPTTPISPLPIAPPTDVLRKPYHLMNLLRTTMTCKTGGYITRRLHVPQEVWSQGGAKLVNVLEKVRVIEVLCSALEDLQLCSVECFGPGDVSLGTIAGIGNVGRREGEAWISKLEEFSSICDGVVANFGKKLGVGEGFVLKKTSGVTSWGGKLTRQLDKFTNGKNLDSPAAYVQGLSKLFANAQVLDEHTKALSSQPVAPSYATCPADIRTSVELKLKRASEFFASVVLTFVIRDLSQLLDKYAKKCEKWLAE